MNKKVMSLLVCGACVMGAQAADRSVEVSSARLNVSKAKTDVLGRHNSKVQNTPQAFVKNTKPKVLAKANDYPNDSEITSTVGEFRYKAFKGSRKYILDGDTISESSYKSRIAEIERNDNARRNYAMGTSGDYPVDGGNYNFLTYGGETNACAGLNYCYFPDVHLATYYTGPENINAASFPYVAQNISNVNALYNLGAQGNGIGISFIETASPSSGFVPSDKLVREADCNPSYGLYDMQKATKVARALNTVAPGATIHTYSINCSDYLNIGLPLHGNKYYEDQPVHIGTVSLSDIGIGSTRYTAITGVLDKFVYDTRTIQIAAAGDHGRPAGFMSEFALGVNVITVGAIHNDGTYHKTSSWKNGQHVEKSNDPESGASYVKPEIANVSDFFFSDATNLLMRDPQGNGTGILQPGFWQTTSAATYTAATLALLLEKYPFYRWHPEVVKALLLTSSTAPITNPTEFDTDNGKYAREFLDASKLVGKNHSRFWNGNNRDFFVNNQIIFYEKGVKANRKYRAAIAWLSNGEYIANNGVLPQDIDIKVEQDGVILDNSTSVDNPFEMVEFTTRSTNDLKITITRYRNRGGRVILGYNFAEL